jgi:hypothetical protein
MKYLISIALLIIAAVLGVVVKIIYDPFTNSTGTFVTEGVDDNTIAIFAAIPWMLPIIIFVIAIIMVVRVRRG